MRTTRRLVRAAEAAAGIAGMVGAAAPRSLAGRFVRRLARDARYAAASMPGIVYHLSGRRPDPNASDDVLADRVRSALGPLVRRLDIPHVHVMVHDHVATLHGDVEHVWDALRIEYAVSRVSGINGVESHLHVGLAPGDTRPSQGRLHRASSPAMVELLDSARRAGAADPRSAVRSVLCALSERIPDSERAHLVAHLPSDVRDLASPPRRYGAPSPRARKVDEFVAAVASHGGVEPARAEEITRAVVSSLRALVPEEVQDVAATLPGELRRFWAGEPVG
jgi:uncharacterized protein (DUF2267 family)